MGIQASKRMGFGARRVKLVAAKDVQEILEGEAARRADLHREIDTLKNGTEIKALREALAASGPIIEARDREIEDLRAERSKMTDEIILLNGRAEAAEHAERNLKARIEELRAQRDAARADLRDAKARLDKIQESLA